jgi:hypothetical protein
MSGLLKLKSEGGGSVTLAANSAQASDITVTAPTTAGPLNVTGPAFSAYLNGTQSVTSGQYTKITINTKEFDTANAFDASTNYRFQPLVAGYYQVNAAVAPNGTTPGSAVGAIYKNGSTYKYGPYIQATNPNSNVSCIVYLNGSTDYIELWGYQTASVATWGNGSTSTYFQAVFIRGA